MDNPGSFTLETIAAMQSSQIPCESSAKVETIMLRKTVIAHVLMALEGQHVYVADYRKADPEYADFCEEIRAVCKKWL